MQELPKFRVRWGRPYVLVCWAGLDPTGGKREPLDSLTDCEAAAAALERATVPHLAPVCRAAVAAVADHLGPAGFTGFRRGPGASAWRGAALVVQNY